MLKVKNSKTRRMVKIEGETYITLIAEGYEYNKKINTLTKVNRDIVEDLLQNEKLICHAAGFI